MTSHPIALGSGKSHASRKAVREAKAAADARKAELNKTCNELIWKLANR